MRRWAAGIAGMLAALALALPVAPARAAPLSACTATHGTIVAVDFGHWRGPVVRGCGVGASSGFALLHAAGFTSAGDAHDGPAFICRLGDSVFHGGAQYPTPSEDQCVQTPPTSAYWSFWTAEAGRDTWSFSTVGAMSDVPSTGEVELWTFGAASGSRGRPTISPASLRPRPASTVATTTVHTTRAAAVPVTHSTSTAPTTSSRGARTERVRAKRRQATPRTTHAVTRTAATATASTPRAVPVVAATPTRATASGGSPTSVIVGGCLAVLLCGGAGWTAWRRRRWS